MTRFQFGKISWVICLLSLIVCQGVKAAPAADTIEVGIGPNLDANCASDNISHPWTGLPCTITKDSISLGSLPLVLPKNTSSYSHLGIYLAANYFLGSTTHIAFTVTAPAIALRRNPHITSLLVEVKYTVVDKATNVTLSGPTTLLEIESQSQDVSLDLPAISPSSYISIVIDQRADFSSPGTDDDTYRTITLGIPDLTISNIDFTVSSAFDLSVSQLNISQPQSTISSDGLIQIKPGIPAQVSLAVSGSGLNIPELRSAVISLNAGSQTLQQSISLSGNHCVIRIY